MKIQFEKVPKGLFAFGITLSTEWFLSFTLHFGFWDVSIWRTK